MVTNLEYPHRPSSLASRKKVAAKVIQLLSQEISNPSCELFYTSDFQLLVSVVLSAQCTDKAVNRVMRPVYTADEFSPETVVAWGRAQLEKTIKSLGLAPTKSKNIYNISRILINQYNGEVPKLRKELEALPGIGRKSANVILGELFGRPTLAVDTHVYRVTFRIGLHAEANPAKAERELLKIIDRKSLPGAHYLLVLFGRYTCKARNPRCSECRINRHCLYYSRAKAQD